MSKAGVEEEMESGEGRKISYKAARAVSVLGHPFVLLPLTVVIAASRNSTLERALTIGAITILATVCPLLFIIRRNVRAGKWSDHDISERGERKKFYPVAIIVIAVSIPVFRLLDFPRSLLAGMLISVLLLLFGMLINRRSKISLHMAFAVYCAVSLAAVSYPLGAAFILLALAVAWSRVRLARHSRAQVMAGAALGAAAGVLLLLALGFFGAAA